MSAFLTQQREGWLRGTSTHSYRLPRLDIHFWGLNKNHNCSRRKIMYRNSKLATLIVLVILSLWGCSKAPNDAAIGDAVKAGLFSDPQLKTEPIGISVSNGAVTLTGEVSSDAARQQVQSLVWGI